MSDNDSNKESISRDGYSEQLNGVEETLRALIDTSGDTAILMDTEGIILALNEKAAAVENLTRDELIGKNLYDYLPEDLVEERLELAEKIIRSGKQYRYEVARKGKFYDVTVNPIKDSSGKVMRLAIFGRDITQRKLVEIDLLESRRRLARAEKVANLGNWEWHIAENSLIWSDEVYRLFDMEQGNPELTRERFVELVHPEDRIKMESHIEKLLKHGYDEPIIYRILTPKGNLKYLRSVSQASKDENGNVASIFGIVLDITDSQMAEKRLKASEQKFFTLFNSTPVMVAITSLKSGKVVEVNNAFSETIGFSREEIIGHSTVELGMWTNPDDRRRFMEEIMEYGYIRDRYYKIKRRDGEILDANVSVDIIEIEGEKHLISVTSDITDQKRHEQEREKLITELEGALEKIKKLSGFIPICPSCKKIRDLQGFWNELESYIHEHSEAEFTHALCPDCTKKLYPDLDLDSLKDSN
ncbi:MAG: PAS domain S-box protein [candidate division Zixibacteria bacterium]|nr:PAS domain S-box protein [candidate division Zixibacteria bacterium]